MGIPPARATLLTLGAAVLLVVAACTPASDVGVDTEPEREAPSPTVAEDPNTTTSIVLGPRDDAPVAGVSMAGRVLRLEVAVGSCVEVEGWSEQGPESVVVGAWQRKEIIVTDDADTVFDCEDILNILPIEIELTEPLGDRELIVTTSLRGPSPADPLCFTVDDDSACQRFTLRTGTEDRVIAGPIEVNATDILIGSGATTALTMDERAIEFTTEAEVTDPFIVYRYSLFQPEDGVWGEITVHNLDRDHSGAAPFEVPVDGREAFTLPAPEGGRIVLIAVGPWWVDVEVRSSDAEPGSAKRDRFLAGLRIEEVPGDLPRLIDDLAWAVGQPELNIVAGSNGFAVSLAPNCEPGYQRDCVADVGFVFPPYETPASIAGERQDHVEPVVLANVPRNLRLTITELGPDGELVMCDGVPTFDPLILPESVRLHEATGAIEIFTGDRGWQRRFQPGIETWYLDEPDDPRLVATYVRNDDGTWDAESVTSCR